MDYHHLIALQARSRRFKSLTATSFSIVEMEQGRLAAGDMAVCSIGGGTRDGWQAECNQIIDTGSRIQMWRAAEEKRKDDARDKAHHLNSK